MGVRSALFGHRLGGRIGLSVLLVAVAAPLLLTPDQAPRPDAAAPGAGSPGRGEQTDRGERVLPRPDEPASPAAPALRRTIDFLSDRAEPDAIPARGRALDATTPREPPATAAADLRSGQERSTKRDRFEPHERDQAAPLTRYSGAVEWTIGPAYAIPALAGAALLGAVAIASLVRERRANRRKTVRRRVSQPGRIVAAALASPLDCIILDISLGGARLGLTDGCRLPAEFKLVFPQTGLTHDVAVRWRKDLELGVQFLS